MNLKTLKEGLTRSEMRSVKGGSGSSGIVCDVTVVACYHYNYKKRWNAYNGDKGWVCCPK